MNLKDQRFGVELEFGGMSRQKAAETVRMLVSDEERPIARVHEHGLDVYKVTADDGRVWKIVSDSSVRIGRGESCELVTPILKYEDMEMLQGIVRALSGAGARADSSCGLHVHVDGANHDARSIKNLSLICASKQEIMFKALKVPMERYTTWCKPADASFIDFLVKNRNPSLEQIEDAYYKNSHYSRYQHYNDARYRLINLHDYFHGHGTVEFRAFNGESKKGQRHIHAGEVKAYVDFSLAISAQAINNKHCKYKPFDSENENYTFRTWLVGHQGLRLNGPEFKNTRMHLTQLLEGDSAYKNREAAIARREKRKAEKFNAEVSEIMESVSALDDTQRTQILQQLQQIVALHQPQRAESTTANTNTRGRGGR